MTAMSSAKTYGLPYSGSKRRIAGRIVDILPEADCLVDVFAGGCAVTHAALLSGKFRTVIANDLSDYPAVFYAAFNGRVPSYRWVSREEFFAKKDSDPVIARCWSFGNDGSTYLYGKSREPWCRAGHMAVMRDDFSGIPAEIAPGLREAMRGKSTWKARYLAYKTHLRSLGLQHLQHLQHLERLERLERGDTRADLVVMRRDYRDLHIPEGAVVYCDPPYREVSNTYGVEFDHDAFYAWARAVSLHREVYISEYWMPSDFQCVAEFPVRKLAGGYISNHLMAIERLYTL